LWFLFFSTPFIVAKFLIEMNWSPDSEGMGNTISEIVTVKGFAKTAIRVPYLYGLPYQRTNLDLTSINRIAPTITVSAYDTPKSAGDVLPTVHMVVYNRVGEQFMFYSQREPQLTAIAEPTAEMQCSLASITTEYPINKYEVNEQVLVSPPIEETTFEGLAKRWSCRSSDVLDIQELSTVIAGKWSTQDCLMSTFMFFRGSWKIKGMPNASFVGQDVRVKMDSGRPIIPGSVSELPDYRRVADGMHAISVGLTEVFEITKPYLSTSEWQPVWDKLDGWFSQLYDVEDFLVWGSDGSTPAIDLVAVAFGNDVKFSYDLPPPQFSKRWY
jgi:hypothetical protein